MDKSQQRKFYRNVRDSILFSDKSNYDKQIFKTIVSSDLYLNSRILLVYVSFGSEVDTRNLIEHSLKIGKKVAVPYCNGSNMLFYEIKSKDELIAGRFGIPTVDISDKLPLSSFDNALCIVPGVCFDCNGNRIGYGGGYYDRFLADNSVTSLGICYEKCLCSKIEGESFDVKIDCVLTENGFRNFKSQEVSTYE